MGNKFFMKFKKLIIYIAHTFIFLDLDMNHFYYDSVIKLIFKNHAYQNSQYYGYIYISHEYDVKYQKGKH